MSGLKRYFHEKRGRGLISAEGVQLLDHACSAAVDRSSQRLNIWTNIEKYAESMFTASPQFAENMFIENCKYLNAVC